MFDKVTTVNYRKLSISREQIVENERARPRDPSQQGRTPGQGVVPFSHAYTLTRQRTQG